MDNLDKLFEDIEFQLNNESRKYRKLKICKYSFEISILSLAIGLSFISIFAILSMILIPIIDN